MFDNAGGTIKSFAKVLYILELIASILVALYLCCTADVEELRLLFGLILLFAGPFLAWVKVLFIYAFGELVEKTCKIEEHLNRNEQNNIRQG